jgi:hypothetical protein
VEIHGLGETAPLVEQAIPRRRGLEKTVDSEQERPRRIVGKGGGADIDQRSPVTGMGSAHVVAAQP